MMLLKNVYSKSRKDEENETNKIHNLTNVIAYASCICR